MIEIVMLILIAIIAIMVIVGIVAIPIVAIMLQATLNKARRKDMEAAKDSQNK